jgi:hypothetical protein
MHWLKARDIIIRERPSSFKSSVWIRMAADNIRNIIMMVCGKGESFPMPRKSLMELYILFIDITLIFYRVIITDFL